MSSKRVRAVLAGAPLVRSVTLLGLVMFTWWAGEDVLQPFESILSALASFRGDEGRYPERLEELHGFRVPGRRWLRASLLNYTATPTGYDLWFRDWLVTHVASDRSGFVAQK